jgi:imidazolonepropionase-like amidohydrolase
MKRPSPLFDSIVWVSLLVFATTACAQQSAAPAATAKDEAIPELRDARVIVLTHARLIDGTGASPKENQSLVIRDGKIADFGEDGEVKVPENAHTLDMAGRSVLPGLVMLHEHLFTDMFPNSPTGDNAGLSHPQHFSFPRLYLAYGVTTIRTAGTDFPYMDLNLKRRIDAGAVPGPEIHLTSPYFSGEGDRAIGAMILHDPEEARRAVRYWAAEGFTSFKAYQWVPKEALAALIDEAHRLELPVTAHLRSVSCREVAEMGIDNIEHGCIRTADKHEADWNGPQAQALFRTLADRNVALTATPTNGRKPIPDGARELLDSSVRERLASLLAVNPPATPAGENPRDTPYAHFITGFVKAGGRLVLGSDAGSGSSIAGLADHEAIENLVKYGFAPLEAIRIATLDGATFLGIQNRTGSIQLGKEADLFVVRGNPAEHIEDIEKIEMVFTNGVAYDPKALLAKVKGQVGWQ